MLTLDPKHGSVTGLVLTQQVLQYLGIVFLLIGNWKSVPWILLETRTGAGVVTTRPAYESLWTLCTNTGRFCDAGDANFVQAMFIISALALVGAGLFSTFTFYQLYGKLKVKTALFISSIFQFISMFAGLLVWSITYSKFTGVDLMNLSTGAYAEWGLKLYVVYWVVNIIAFIIGVYAWYIYKGEEGVVDPAAATIPAPEIPDADKLYLVATIFTGAAAASAWGAVVVSNVGVGSSINLALTAFLIMNLLVLTPIAILLIHGFVAPSKKPYLSASIALVGLSVPFGILTIILSGIVGIFPSIGGFCIAATASSIVAVALLAQCQVVWGAKTLAPEHAPLPAMTFVSSSPTLTQNLLLTNAVFALLTMALLFPTMLMVGAFARVTPSPPYSGNNGQGSGPATSAIVDQIQTIDTIQFFGTLGFLMSIPAYLLAVLALQVNSPIRVSTAALSSWVLSLLVLVCVIITCAVVPAPNGPVGNGTFYGFIIPAIATSFVAMVCGAVAWSHIRLSYNPRKGNVCTVLGKPCCPGSGPCGNQGLCAEGNCCYSAQSYDHENDIVLEQDPDVQRAAQEVELEKLKTEAAEIAVKMKEVTEV